MQVSLKFILILVYTSVNLACAGQHTIAKPSPNLNTAAIPISDSVLPFKDWLIVEKAFNLARQNPAEMISLDKCGDYYGKAQGYPRELILYIDDQNIPDENFYPRMRKEKIDVSRSKTLDYKGLSNKYPKNNEVLNAIGTILISIYQDEYARRNYDMFLIKK